MPASTAPIGLTGTVPMGKAAFRRLPRTALHLLATVQGCGT